MDILMLGQSNAGKTSYVSAMYATMTNGVSGFTVRAERSADHQRLCRNAERMRGGVYPPATDQRSVYNLQLWHAGDRVFDFMWRDYRGGALVESSESPQAMQLRTDIANAGGLVVMIDSTELTGGPRARSRVRPLIATTIRLLSTRENIMPLVIALTKWDLVRASEEQTQQAASDLLGDLVSAVGDTKHIYGTLIPIACGAQPMNIILPVLWCLHIGIAASGTLLQRRLEFHQQLVDAAAARRGFWDRTRAAWAGRPNADQIHAYGQQQIRDDLLRIQPLIVPSQKLNSLFEPVFKF